ncbi:hypothetical protein GCM10010302_09290 [Streptomyces polychromogenes]|uniref:Histidine kinase/HSP90-like ATPase domain-containing protein n=1 Tax=Streptomyces polychromogenes TaxID=67342 RepID=A0ABN0V3T3_9ACTN
MGFPVRRRWVCGVEGAAARARAEIGRFIADGEACGLAVPASAREVALLVASEMVANAARHTGGPCVLEVAWGVRGGLDIDVTDTSPDPPRPRPPDLAGGGGFGWPLVNVLATDVHVRPSSGGGKTVHAHVQASSQVTGSRCTP